MIQDPTAMHAPSSARRLLLLVPLVLLATGCNLEERVHHYFMKEEAPHKAEWGYSGAEGPSHWGELSPDYALASTGRSQSPIDLTGAAHADLPALEFDYRPVSVNVVFNGHSIQENESGSSSLTVGGKRFSLEQFHFHSPSEHTVDGRHSPMEMHLVHKGADGEVAVVGVMIEAGEENAALELLWQNLPTVENRANRTEMQIDVGAVLPADHDYLHYTGSFTTPPCTEDVRWMMMRQPIQLSKAQIAAFRAIINNNNRPVQPLNGRAIESSN